MRKVNDIAGATAKFFKSRGVGFYLPLPVVIISFIIPFVYNAGLGKDYFSAAAFALPFLAIPLFAGAFFKPTSKYVALALFILEFVALLLFVKAAYMQLAKGFLDDNDLLAAAGPHFIFCVIAYLVNIVLSVTAMFLRQYKRDNLPTVTVETEGVAE